MLGICEYLICCYFNMADITVKFISKLILIFKILLIITNRYWISICTDELIFKNIQGWHIKLKIIVKK